MLQRDVTPAPGALIATPSGVPGNSPGVNDFAFKIATVNGTGSASANSLLMQAIFRMGIPVTGKNVFPSNIQGLPTWYEIRVSGEGYTARAPDFDLVVIMNPATFGQDIAAVREGGYVLYDSSWPLPAEVRREGVTYLGVPLGRMCVDAFSGSRERVLMKNIAYVGALAALLRIDLDVVEQILHERFSRKKALMASNYQALHLGYDYALERLDCPLPFHLEPMDATGDQVLLDGNTACALGCLYAGATVAAWYPITPATSLMDAFDAFCRRYRIDPKTQRKRYAIIQAEDELSAAGMVIGAAWAGARSFTSTAGPGISLMSEFLGLAYYAEVPGVFFDVQRTGPSTGMPTRTQQGDLLQIAYASHGDTKHIALFPADPGECFYMAVQAFDLSDRFQTPVFVVSDLDLGMNDWMVPKLRWDDGYRADRGKVLGEAELSQIDRFYRYLDRDGDGIAARTLPGVHPKGAYFTRGSGHNELGGYTEDPAEYQKVMDRLARKIDGAAEVLPAPAVQLREGARWGMISIGGCDAAVREALDRLDAAGLPLDYLRVRGFPFAQSVTEFLHAHPWSYVVEQNRDAQLRSLLAVETEFPMDRMISLRYYGGMPLSAGEVVAGVRQHLTEHAHAVDLQAAD